MRLIPLIAIVLLAGCGPAAPSGGGKKRPVLFPVQVEPVKTEMVTSNISAPGQIEAFETVSITARVRGVCEEVAFAIGDQVTPDQVLVRIEEERYRLAAESARAVLAKTTAARTDATASLERREKANRENPGVLRDEDLSTARTRVLSAAAEAQAAQAALALAELDLKDARVRAPFAGIIQSRDIETGRYVQPGTVLATLIRRDPVQVRFVVDAVDAPRIKPGMPFTCTVSGHTAPVAGTIVFVADSADRASRQVLVLGRVETAAARDLKPGTFASISVPIANTAAVVVPATAIQPGESGFSAWVVVEENGKTVARQHQIRMGLRTLDGRVEIREGLTPGERLVIRGAAALTPGCEVEIRTEKGEKIKPEPGSRGSQPAAERTPQ